MSVSERGGPGRMHDVAVRVRPAGNRRAANIDIHRPGRGDNPRMGSYGGENMRTVGHARLPAPKPQHGAVSRSVSAAVGGGKFMYGLLAGRSGSSLPDHFRGEELTPRLNRAFDSELRTGLRVLVVGVGLVGGWAALVPLSGAVVVPGILVAETSVKKVQHPTGGVVKEILVRDGVHVNAGDLVVRLDETQSRANLQVVTKQLDDLNARIARLTAERDGVAEPQMLPEAADRPGTKEAEHAFTAEKGLFKARTSARQSQIELLRGRVGQLKDEIAGLNAQLQSKASQIESIASEQQAVQGLYDKHLVPMTRLTSLQREAARIEGERGQIVSSLAETQAKISEAELQIVRTDQDFRTEVIKDLREAQGKAAELGERAIAAQDQLDRIEIRAPVSGVVNQMTIHTVGGVIAPAEVLMTVVPEADDLQIEARLPPQDIDQVQRGQDAFVRLSAFNQRTTPQLSGNVSLVSADLTRDPSNPNVTPFYTVRVTLAKEEISRLDGKQLVSGMPAEVFLQTGSRTMLSYLFKPLTDQLKRTFNER